MTGQIRDTSRLKTKRYLSKDGPVEVIKLGSISVPIYATTTGPSVHGKQGTQSYKPCLKDSLGDPLTDRIKEATGNGKFIVQFSGESYRRGTGENYLEGLG